jgi:hypothetical protein
MAKEFTCERDGFVMSGETDDELAAQVERHIAEAHLDLAGKLSRSDILAEIRATGRGAQGDAQPVTRRPGDSYD